LDSVPEGPGINDNGSGSATVLEMAIQWASRGFTTENQIQFSWWGAEEIGLLGYRYFVNVTQTNSPDQWNNIALALNFDMLGSPNYILAAFDGVAAIAANASVRISNIFVEYFQQQNVTYALIPLSGGSDYVPFMEAGKPVGGLAAGASDIKTDAQRTLYGGTANAALDPCYHLACDTVNNINIDGLKLFSQAAAYTLQQLAQKQDLKGYLNN